MKNVLHLGLLTFAMSGLLATPVFAGGGSTKSNPELEVENDTNQEVYVVVNPSSDFEQRVFNRLNEQQGQEMFGDAFTALGGAVIGDEESEDFEVRKGNVVIRVADADAVDAIFMDQSLTPSERRAAIAAEFFSDTINVQSDTTVKVSSILGTNS